MPKPFNWPIEHRYRVLRLTGAVVGDFHTLAPDGPKGYGGQCQVCKRWVLRGMGAWWDRQKAPLSWGC